MDRRIGSPDVRLLFRIGLPSLLLFAVVFPLRYVSAEEVPAIRVCLSPEFLHASDPRDVAASLQAFADAVGEAMGRRGFPVRMSSGYTPPLEELAEKLRTGEVDLAYVSVCESVRLRQITEAVPLVTVSSTAAGDLPRAVVITRANGPAGSLKDLRKRRFVYVNPNSLIGFLYPHWRVTQIENGEGRLSRFFESMVRVTNEKSAIYAVLMGKADVASVSSVTLDVMSEMNGSLERKLRRIEVSEPMAMGVLVTGPGADRRLVGAAVECLLDSKSHSPALNELLRHLKITGVRRAVDEDLLPIEKMLTEIEEAQDRWVDPICGMLLSNAEAVVRSGVVPGSETSLGFCGQKCLDTYQEHRRRSLAGEENLVVVAICRDTLLNDSPSDAIALLEMMLEVLEAEHGIDIEVEVLPGLTAVRERLAEKSLAGMQLTGPAYVRLHEEFGITPLLRRTLNSECRAVLVVQPGLIRSVKDLEGKSIAMAATGDSPLLFFLRKLLEGEDVGGFFGRTIQCPSEESAVNAVAIGESTAALVSHQTLEVLRELRGSVFERLVVLKSSEEFIAGPTCVSREFPAHLAERLRDYMMHIHETEAGRALLQFLGTPRIVEASDSEYDSFRRLVQPESRPGEDR